MAARRLSLAALTSLAQTGDLALRIRGQCMHPELAEGRVVQIRPRRWPWPGEIAVYLRSDGDISAHRMLGYWPCRAGVGLLTMSDGALDPDPVVPRARLIGVVREELSVPRAVLRGLGASRRFGLALRRRLLKT